MEENKEIRNFVITELRLAQNDGEPKKLYGYAAVFDQLSEDLGGFQEKIAPGAFTKTILESDVRALWNHDPNFVLGRNKANTLSLAEDAHGLSIIITPPDTQWANDLMQSIQRGDVDQMSFAFRTIKDTWTREEGKNPIRTLNEVALFDVSPVTYPAYPQTSIQARDIEGLISRSTTPIQPVHGDHSVDDGETDAHGHTESRLQDLRNKLSLMDAE